MRRTALPETAKTSCDTGSRRLPVFLRGGEPIPAAHRLVNAVYFDPRHAAALRGITTGEPVILLALDDENGQPIPHAIGLASNGKTIALGNVRLSTSFVSYPAVRIVAVPIPLLVLVSLLGIGVGMALHVQERRTVKAEAA